MLGSVRIGYFLDFGFASWRMKGLFGVVVGTAIWGDGLANQLRYTDGKWDRLIDFKDGSRYAGPFLLYFSYGLLDAMFQSLIYWIICALTNESQILSRYQFTITLPSVNLLLIPNGFLQLMDDDEYDDLDDFIVDNDDGMVSGEEQQECELDKLEEGEEDEEEEGGGGSCWARGDHYLQGTAKGGHQEKKNRHSKVPSPAWLAARWPCRRLSKTDLASSLNHLTRPSLSLRVIEEGCSSIMKETQNLPSRKICVSSSSKVQPIENGQQQKPKFVSEAYESLTDRIGRTASTLIGNPIKVYNRGDDVGSALATVVCGALAAAVAPVSTSARALHYALLGLRNR
ncbi:hypothetical protein ABZP36_029514 [Zizania latifolia]